jgi:hypothetical protein
VNPRHGPHDRAQTARLVGHGVLILSGLGFPLTQWTIQRFGRRGAVITEGVCAALLARDILMIGSGVPGRLRTVPATLLCLEATSSAGTVVLGANVTQVARANAPDRSAPFARELRRRRAVGTLFGLHTLRFWIYLSPDQGRRTG